MKPGKKKLKRRQRIHNWASVGEGRCQAPRDPLHSSGQAREKQRFWRAVVER